MRLSKKLLHDSKARGDFLKDIKDYLCNLESGLVFWTNPSETRSWAGVLMKNRPSSRAPGRKELHIGLHIGADQKHPATSPSLSENAPFVVLRVKKGILRKVTIKQLKRDILTKTPQITAAEKDRGYVSFYFGVNQYPFGAKRIANELDSILKHISFD
jgi:hypothetical protein